MSWYNKVVWSEGLFLHPQLFQQQERYLEHFSHARAMPGQPFFWGFGELEIDSDSLPLGKIALRTARGLFQDGTPFETPGHVPLPEPLRIGAEQTGQLIFLVLPARQVNGEELSFEAVPNANTRNVPFETEIRDGNSMGMEPQLVQLANLRLRLMARNELGGALMELELARIAEVRNDGGVVLDPDFVPTVNRCAAAPKLCTWLDELLGLVRLRAEALAQTLAGSNSAGAVAEVADWLLLQTLNRYEPLLDHLAHVRNASPEELYRVFLTLSGELSTFLRFSTRRPQSFLPYRHSRSGTVFRPLMEDLRALLNVVFERSARQIPLINMGNSQWMATLGIEGTGETGDVNGQNRQNRQSGQDGFNALHRSGMGFSSLVLGVSARLPREVLVQEFMARAKISAPERLEQHVRSHMPGLPLQILPVAPRQIPFQAGMLYFELRREGQLWEQIHENGRLALHVAGEFPSLHMELWGTRD